MKTLTTRMLQATLFATTLSILLPMPEASAGPSVMLTDSNMVEVSIDSPEIRIDIPYPGDISGVCGVRLLPAYYMPSPEDLEQIAGGQRASIENFTRRPNRTLQPTLLEERGVIEYHLPTSVYNTYTTSVYLRAKEGTLQSLWDEVSGVNGLYVYALAVLCE